MSGPAERRLGNVIAGKWRVDSLLGSGSMAAVYAVTHRNGARAALKILHPNLCTDAGVCERFLGEGYLTNSVKHMGIVRVLDDGVTDDGCVFLVMDLLEGKTLETLRQERGGQIPLVELLDIADKLMDALHAVHEGGIIHRDLKLQNVFICDDGAVKLLDFGVARLLDGSAKSKLSTVGLVLGTPSFMSPEQAIGSRDKVDHRSDIWSLGATLFTSLTGQTVHLGPHVQAKLLAAATQKARSILLVKPDLPPQIAAAIDMSLRFDKAERWQKVDAFRRTLRDARRELGLPKPESVPPSSWLDDTEQDAAAVIVTPIRTAIGDSEPPDVENTTMPHIRTPGMAAPPRPALESRPDGSYPAVGSTLEHGSLTAQVGARSSSISTWIAGAVITGAVVGGIGFFAMKSSATADAQSATSAPAPLTSATAPTADPALTPTALPTSMPTLQVEAKDARDVVRDAAAGAPSSKIAVTAPSVAHTAHPALRKKAPDPKPAGEGASASPEPPIPTTLPPDPFGTPD